jgi:mRNA-degrading endonuclease RelE of RelBE toxin-antitoxin system
VGYSVELSKQAADNLETLPRNIQKKFALMLNVLSDNLFPRGCKKMRGVENQYRITFGRKYRIIYTFNQNNKLLYIVDVDHRKDIYR